MGTITNPDLTKTVKALNEMRDYYLSYKKSDSKFNNGYEAVKQFGRSEYRALPLSEHVKGLVYSKLSQQVKWEGVEKKLKDIEELFFYWNIDEIEKHPSSYFLEGLKDLKVGRFRKYLCEYLHNNIHYIKNLLSVYQADTPEFFIACSKNLKGYGIPLVAEYLVYVKVDRIKPDMHVKRFLKRFYNLKTEPTDMEVIQWGKKIMKNSDLNLTLIDTFIWGYCSEVKICEAKPKCEICIIKNLCASCSR